MAREFRSDENLEKAMGETSKIIEAKDLLEKSIAIQDKAKAEALKKYYEQMPDENIENNILVLQYSVSTIETRLQNQSEEELQKLFINTEFKDLSKKEILDRIYNELNVARNVLRERKENNEVKN